MKKNLLFVLLNLTFLSFINAQCDSVIVRSGYAYGDNGERDFYSVEHYNGFNHLLRSAYYYGRETGETLWNPGTKYENLFDLNNNLIQENSYSFSNNVYQNGSQTTYSYSASGKLIGKIRQTWSSNNWIVTDQLVMNYDLQDRLIDSTITNGNAIEKTIFSYDMNGNDSSIIVQNGSVSLPLTNYTRNDYYYDSSGDKIFSVYFNWNSTQWDSISRSRYTYQGNLPDSIIKERLDTVWKNQLLTYYEYSPFDKPVYIYDMSWADTAWIYAYREVHEIDANGYPSFSDYQRAYYEPDGTFSWSTAGMGYSTYTYSADGNLLYVEGRPAIGGPYHSSYSYSGGILTSSYGYSETMGGFISESNSTYRYTDIHGFNSICTGDSTVLFVDSCSGSTHLWSTGATTPSITVNTPGNYSVVTTLPNGFVTSSLPFNVSVENGLPFIPVGPDSTKHICTNSTAQLQVPNLPNVSYQWYRNDTLLANSTSSIITIPGSIGIPGVYYLVATNVCGQDTSAKTTVLINSAPGPTTITSSGPLDFCIGDSITLTSSSADSYQWLPGGETSQSIVVATSANYSVKGFDLNGCYTSATANVHANDFPPEIELSVSNSFIIADYSGSHNQWFMNGDTLTGQTTTNCTPILAGYYYYATANSYPCITYSDSIYLDPDTINVYAGPDVFVCENGNRTAIIGTYHPIIGGTPPFTYSWSPNTNLNNYNTGRAMIFNVTQDETYYLTVTDANGRTAIDSISVILHEAVAPQLTMTTGNEICSEMTSYIEIDYFNEPYTFYHWVVNDDTLNNTTNYLVPRVAGIYQVIITDRHGCNAISAGDTLILQTLTAEPVIHALLDSNVCVSGTGTLWVNNISGSTYSWKMNNQIIGTDTLLQVNYASVYQVKITDASGCWSTNTIEFDPANEEITFGIRGNSDGIYCNDTVSLFAADMDNWTYSWTYENINLNIDSAVIYAFNDGDYSCTAVSPQGCIATGNYTLMQNTVPSITLVQNGFLLSVARYFFWSYEWYLNGIRIPNAFSYEYTASAPGDYMVRIYNSDACESFSNILTLANCGLSVANALVCDSACNGELTAQAFGIGTISYQWSTGQNTEIINSLCPGIYSVTITDSLGCQFSDTAFVSNDSLSLTTIFTSPSCPTCSDGRVELIVVNGVPPYNYFIDPPIVAPSGNNFYGLPAGYYEVCVFDAIGCSVCNTDSILTLVPNLISVSDNVGIYPNPVIKEFYLTGQSVSGNNFIELKIYDSKGNLVNSFRQSSAKFNVENLKAGIYIVQLLLENEVQHLRFVKQ